MVGRGKAKGKEHMTGKDLFVYKAITKFGETAHFGVYSAAKAWAKSGVVEAVPIKNLKLVQKPCDSCESLARAVMLDQTSRDTKKEWVRLTDEEYEIMAETYVTNCYFDTLKYAKAIEAKLKEKNT